MYGARKCDLNDPVGAGARLGSFWFDCEDELLLLWRQREWSWEGVICMARFLEISLVNLLSFFSV